MIQAVVLHGCITRSLTVREKHRLRVMSLTQRRVMLATVTRRAPTRPRTTAIGQCLCSVCTKLERGKEQTLLATTPASE